MENKTIEEMLKQVEYDRETILRFAELQNRLGISSIEMPSGALISNPIRVIKENKKSTGLKDAIIAYLKETNDFVDRTTITKAILPQFPNETLGSLLPKVSNALTKDRGIDNPDFCFDKVGTTKKVWSLASKKKKK